MSITLLILGSYVPPHKRKAMESCDSEPIEIPPIVFEGASTSAGRSSWNPRTPTPGGYGDRNYAYSVNAKGYHGSYFKSSMREKDLFQMSDSPAEPINFDKYDDIPIEVSGTDPPEPVLEFTEEILTPELYSNVLRLNYSKPTPIQKVSIPVALKHRDLMGCAQTGSGKTAGYLCPIISLMLKEGPLKIDAPSIVCPTTLILVPTRELAEQIHTEAQKFCYVTGIATVVVYGGVSFVKQDRDVQKGCDLVVGTPGRLKDYVQRGRISLQGIKYLVLDEADRMLDMGFIPQVKEIVEDFDMPASHQTMMFSATFPTQIQLLAGEFLKDYVFLTVGRVGAAAMDIKQDIMYTTEDEKANKLMDIVLGLKEESILVFVDTRKQADILTNSIVRQGIKVLCIHGDKTQEDRTYALNQFKRGKISILVATDVAARGLDIPSVNYVINYDLPSNIDSYVHRIGRTGRAGRKGNAISFYNDSNSNLASDLVAALDEAEQEIPDFLMNRRMTPRGSNDRRRGNFGGRDHRSNNNNKWSNNKSSYY